MPTESGAYKPRKKSYREYNESGGAWHGSNYDIATGLDPINQVGNLWGFKNPIHGWAEGAYNSVTGSDASNVDRVKFSRLGVGQKGLGIGQGTAALTDTEREAIYNTMTPDELESVGKMTDAEQGNWLLARHAEVKSGTAKAWKDPEDPVNAPILRMPDATDDAVRAAKTAQAQRIGTRQGRRSTFLTGFGV